MKRTTRPPAQQTLPSPDYLPTESQIAIAFVDYVNKTHPNLSEDLIKIDNENKCSWAEGKRKKAEGKRKGASDYFFAKPALTLVEIESPPHYRHAVFKPVYLGLWLELKTKKGKESPEQKAFGIRMISNGYAYRVAHSVDEAIAIFEEYIKPQPNRIL